MKTKNPSKRELSPTWNTFGLVALFLGGLAPNIAHAQIVAPPPVFYVATNGSDSNSGSQQAPFATFEKAQQAARAARVSQPSGSVATIWVGDGTYYRTNSLQLTSADANLVIMAEPTASPRLCGGLPLRPAWFSPVTTNSPVWLRLDPSAQGNVMQVNLGTYGITNLPPLLRQGGWGGGIGELSYTSTGPFPSELYINDQPQQLARWPNATNNASRWAATSSRASSRSFTYTGTRPGRWLTAPDPWYHGLWGVLDSDDAIAGKSISGSGSSWTITLAQSPSAGLTNAAPWFVFNLLEELDTPGEYYIDRTNQILYLWPPANFGSADVFVSQMDSPLISLGSGASNIVINGLELSGGRGDLLSMDSTCVNCQFTHGRLMGAGREGAQVYGVSNSVTASEIGFCGNNGVLMGGGNRPALTSCGNSVNNCRIHDFSRLGYCTAGVNIWLETADANCGLNIEHNYFYNAPQTAIIFAGNNNLIAFNDISNACLWADDCGAIYTGRDWGFRGNNIQDNFIHDISSGFAGSSFLPWDQDGVHGVYLDDCVSGIEISSNVFYQVQGCATFNGGGRDNIWINNVIAECGFMHHSDARGPSDISTNNGSDWNLLQKIQVMNYQQPPWSTAYPALAAIPDSYSLIGPYEYPGGTVFSENIGWNNTTLFQEYDNAFNYYAQMTNNVTDSNPRFVDEAGGDLTLASNSPAFSIPGFGAIPFLAIGIGLPVISNEQAIWAPAGFAAAVAWIDPRLDTNCVAQLYYGPVDCGRTTNSWTYEVGTNVSARGWVLFQVPSQPGQSYYGRFRAVNQSGESWSQNTVIFPLANVFKANNSTNLDFGASWVGGVAPAAANIAIWDSTVTGANTVSMGGNLSWGGISISNVGGAVTINPGNTLTLGAAGIDLSDASANLTLNCGLALGAPQAWTTGPGLTLTVGGSVANGGNGLTITGVGNAVVNGDITGLGGLTNAASGTVTLMATNGYTGDTTVNAGTLVLPPGENGAGIICGSLAINSGAQVNADTDWALGWSGTSGVTSITINGGTLNLTGVAGMGGLEASNVTLGVGSITGNTFDWYGGLYQSLSTGPVLTTVAGSAPSVISSGFNLGVGVGENVILNVAQGTTSNGVDLLISGPISDSFGGGGITKIGGGTVALNGANTYTEPTVVSNGILLVNGALGTGGVTVEGGALGGVGLIAGPVAINGGGTLAIGGTGIGTLAISNTLTLNSGGASFMRITKVGGTATNDSVAGISTLTYNGTLTVTNLAGTPAVGDTFKLFGATGYTGNFAATNLPVLGSGLAWNWVPATGTLAVVATLPPPLITGFSDLATGGFSLTFSGSNGASYSIYTTTNLASPIWTMIATGVLAGEPVTFQDLAATNYPTRFYKVTSP